MFEDADMEKVEVEIRRLHLSEEEDLASNKGHKLRTIKGGVSGGLIRIIRLVYLIEQALGQFSGLIRTMMPKYEANYGNSFSSLSLMAV